MTVWRQEITGWSCKLGLIFLVAWSLAPIGARAATSERQVQDRHTGLAIGGIDPVGYFTQGRPMAGLREFEIAEGGAIWRFHNEGNLAAFKARPDIYGPQFGGYDPVDVARGVTRAGNPRVWLIAGQRLFLFADEENRDAFASGGDGLLREARARWPALRATLTE